MGELKAAGIALTALLQQLGVHGEEALRQQRNGFVEVGAGVFLHIRAQPGDPVQQMLRQKIQLLGGGGGSPLCQKGHIFQLSGDVVLHDLAGGTGEGQPGRIIDAAHLLPGLLPHQPLTAGVDGLIGKGALALILAGGQKYLGEVGGQLVQNIRVVPGEKIA